MHIVSAALSGLAVSFWVYAAFVVVVLALLALDLGVFHRKAHAPSMRESINWTAGWVALAIVFAGLIYFLYENHIAGLGLAVPVVGSPGNTTALAGADAAKLYLTAYIVEKSLSMDNVFVIAMIFTSFAIPAAYQHRVLFWGILGALIMRGMMIGLGAAVVAEFSWIVYVFGGLLILSALKMALVSESSHDMKNSRLVRFVGRFLPITPKFHGQKLTARINQRRHATPLLLALVVVEATDVLFAVDSIPAVFAITGDPFIVFTSNIMAILGLRSLYFCLAAAVARFTYLKPALIAILLFVGVKMCLVHTPWKLSSEVAMGVVFGLLFCGIVASLICTRESAVVDSQVPTSTTAPISLSKRRGDWRTIRIIWKANRTLRRAVILFAGTFVLLLGLLISPLPGPGLTVLGPLGVAILASEFLWARRLAAQAIAREKHFRASVDRVLSRVSRIMILPVILAVGVLFWRLDQIPLIPDWMLWAAAVPISTPFCYILFRWYRVRAERAVGI